MKIRNIAISLTVSTILGLGLIGCGGGGSSGGASGGTSSTTGTLIDNVVSGIKYVGVSSTGYTDINGQFPYTEGLVEFYLGDIKLGQMNAMTSDNNIFIQDILGIDRTNTNDPKLLKLATLLQSLDSDLTTDKIEIDRNDFDLFANTNQEIDDLDVGTILSSKGFTVIDEEDVIAHIENSQKEYEVILDTDAPTLDSSSIISGQTGVSKSSAIVLTFSEDIPKEYLTSSYFMLEDYPSKDVVETNIESNRNIVTITPINELLYSQSLEFTISSELKDFAGNSLSNNGGNTDILIEFLVEDEVDTTAPTITSDSIVSVDENQTSAFIAIATDNSSTLVYTLTGTDADTFNINSTTGVITFKASPDYEVKNSYSIILNVTDGSNNSSLKNITVNINDVYEADISYPVFTSEAAVSVAENQTDALTLIATDNSVVTYSLTGTDTNSFNINSTSGIVTFKTAPNYESKSSYSIVANATDSSNNIKTQNVTITITDVYENTPPTANAGVDQEIYITEDVTFDASSSSDNSSIINYEWMEGSVILSDQVSFVKSDFTSGEHNITLNVTDDENQSSSDVIKVTVFSDFENILPMDEVGGIKSISSSTIGTTTTTTLSSGSQLYFKITNDMNRSFTVNSFKITSYYNGTPTLRVSSTDSSLLSNGTLDTSENISLGYILSSSQTANYWIGTYSLTDINTGEIFTNSFIWNGTRY